MKTDCIVYKGYVLNSGYCLWTKMINGKRPLAHRVVYESVYGKIPKGLTIDHLCKNRRCINVDHLEAVTSRENSLRSDNIAAKNSKKTTCPKGHYYSPDNTYIYHGRRFCRTCRKENEKLHRFYLEGKRIYV